MQGTSEASEWSGLHNTSHTAGKGHAAWPFPAVGLCEVLCSPLTATSGHAGQPAVSGRLKVLL